MRQRCERGDRGEQRGDHDERKDEQGHRTSRRLAVVVCFRPIAIANVTGTIHSARELGCRGDNERDGAVGHPARGTPGDRGTRRH